MNPNNESGNSQSSSLVVASDDTLVDEVLSADTPVLVDFMATWCGPCKIMGPVFASMAPEYSGRVKFAKMDVDENPEVAGLLGIGSIPTFVLFARNVPVAAGVGAMQPDDLREWIDEALTRVNRQPAQPAAQDA